MFGCFIIALAGIISITDAYYNNYAYQSQGPWGQYQDENGNTNYASHSSFSSGGGSNIAVNRRMGPNQESIDVISMTNPNVKIDGDYFNCSTLLCPKESFKCVITSETKIDDKQHMKTVVECQDKDGKILKQKEYLETNPHPEMEPPYSRHAIVDRDGKISIEDSNGNNIFNSNQKLTKEEQDELIRNVNMQTSRMNEQMQQQQRQFQRQMQEFHSNMNNMQQQMQEAFGKGFPFGNNFNFGNNFPFGGYAPYNFYNPYNAYNPQPQPYNPQSYEPHSNDPQQYNSQRYSSQSYSPQNSYNSYPQNYNPIYPQNYYDYNHHNEDE